jgi:hypothetical protein
MIAAVAMGWLAVVMAIPDFMNSSYTKAITSPVSTFTVIGLHLFLGIAILGSGTWLIALLRPRSTIEFAAKSKRIWQTNLILWLSAYVVGILVFVTLHTTFFR